MENCFEVTHDDRNNDHAINENISIKEENSDNRLSGFFAEVNTCQDESLQWMDIDTDTKEYLVFLNEENIQSVKVKDEPTPSSGICSSQLEESGINLPETVSDHMQPVQVGDISTPNMERHLPKTEANHITKSRPIKNRIPTVPEAEGRHAHFLKAGPSRTTLPSKFQAPLVKAKKSDEYYKQVKNPYKLFPTAGSISFNSISQIQATVIRLNLGSFVIDAPDGLLMHVETIKFLEEREVKIQKNPELMKLLHTNFDLQTIDVFSFVKPFTFTFRDDPVNDDIHQHSSSNDEIFLYCYLKISGAPDIEKMYNKDIINISKLLPQIEVDTGSLIIQMENETLINFNTVSEWDSEAPKTFRGLFNLDPLDVSKNLIKSSMLALIKREPRSLKSSKNMKFCQICKYRSKSWPGLIHHLTRNDTVFTYNCRSCGFLKFNNLCSLAYHSIIDLHRSPKKEICLSCGKRFLSLGIHLRDFKRKRLQQTESIGIPMGCRKCKFVTDNSCALNYHLEDHAKGEKSSVCLFCGTVFFNASDYICHCSLGCTEAFRKVFYVCSHCSLYFSRSEDLGNHIYNYHYKRFYMCCFCQIGFSEMSKIKSHMCDSHQLPNMSYQIFQLCTLCPQNKYSCNNQLDHLLEHTSEDKMQQLVYQCECNFVTLKVEKISLHMRGECLKPRNFSRGEFMKICSVCEDLQTFNYTSPFVCESCEAGDDLTLFQCNACKGVIGSDYDVVIDHFMEKHCKKLFDVVKFRDVSVLHTKRATKEVNNYNIDPTETVVSMDPSETVVSSPLDNISSQRLKKITIKSIATINKELEQLMLKKNNPDTV